MEASFCVCPIWRWTHIFHKFSPNKNGLTIKYNLCIIPKVRTLTNWMNTKRWKDAGYWVQNGNNAYGANDPYAVSPAETQECSWRTGAGRGTYRISEAYYEIYPAAYVHTDVYQKDIEEEFRIRKSTVTGILKLLEKMGLSEEKVSKRMPD